jgi:hypothetical protein
MCLNHNVSNIFAVARTIFQCLERDNFQDVAYKNIILMYAFLPTNDISASGV